MKYSFVTHFDFRFAPQGLSLYTSLRKHHPESTLIVVCLDEACFQYLSALKLESLRPLNLSDYENKQLLGLKSERTISEYYWTITPWCMIWAFDIAPEIEAVVYVDADLYFIKSTQNILIPFFRSSFSVLLTPHDYSPENDQTLTSGEFCVQYIVAKREDGLEVISWWANKCIEWCFDRFENGLFGDQKYLEQFHLVFPGRISNLYKKGYFQGPWNAGFYPYSRAAVFHFHGLRIQSSTSAYLSGYYTPKPTIDNIYLPYLSLLYEHVDSLHTDFKPQIKKSSIRATLQSIVKKSIEKLTGRTRPPYWSKRNRKTKEISAY